MNILVTEPARARISAENMFGKPSKYLVLHRKAIAFARAANQKRDGHPQYALGWSRREAAMHLKSAAAMRRHLKDELDSIHGRKRIVVIGYLEQGERAVA